MKKRPLFLSLMVAAMLHPASALALTAVCKEPRGHVLGVHGVLGKGKPLDSPDGMTGRVFTIVWSRGQEKAQITSQGGGARPLTETGIRAFESDEQVSFLVPYSSAVWLYSLYPIPKILLMTTHNNGMAVDTGGAIVKSFVATCEIVGN